MRLESLILALSAAAMLGSGCAAPFPCGRVEFQDLAWSPDGREILFTTHVSDDRASLQVWTVSADPSAIGSGPTRLTLPPDIHVDPAWSPDGRQIAAISYHDGAAQLWVMNADGSSPTRLAEEPGATYLHAPTWSPGPGAAGDGAWIAFSTNLAGAPGVYVIPSGGGPQTWVGPDPSGSASPTWLPDGRHLVYISFQQLDSVRTERHLYLVDRESLARRELFPPSQNRIAASDLALSPDGKTVAIWDYDGQVYQIEFVNLDGETPAWHPPLDGIIGSWSPDGRQFAFVTPYASSQNHIAVTTPAGPGQADLTLAGMADSLPVWSPDGARIAFVRMPSTYRSIFVMNADGSGPTDLMPMLASRSCVK